MLDSESVVARNDGFLFLKEIQNSLKLLENEKECSIILKQLDKHERRIERREKSSIDFLRYVQYCMDLTNLLNERRIKNKVKKQKFVKCEKFINQMINKAFRIFVYRNQGDLDMWKAFIAFNKQVNTPEYVSKLYLRFLKVNSDSIDIWLEAALWELEKRNDFDASRLIFQRALAFYPKNTNIWLKYVDMECMFTQKIKDDEVFAKSQVFEKNSIDRLKNGELVKEILSEAKINDISSDCFSSLFIKYLWFEDILNNVYPEERNHNTQNAALSNSQKECIESLSKECLNDNFEIAEYFSHVNTDVNDKAYFQLIQKFCLDLKSIFSKEYKFKKKLVDLLKVIPDRRFGISIVEYFKELKKVDILLHLYKNHFAASTEKSNVASQIFMLICKKKEKKLNETLKKEIFDFSNDFIEGKLISEDPELWIQLAKFVKKDHANYDLETLDRLLTHAQKTLNSEKYSRFISAYHFL